MNFLYPSFLWALGVLVIPVIIHLFNFRKTTRIFFSNTRFLKQVKESTTAKRKLKHYLILASRLLFLLFLVLAFCQPVIPAREQLVNHQNVVFYLDNSQSMSAPLEDRTRGLDVGIGFVTEIVNAFPPDSRYKLITNDFAPYSNSFKTKTEIEELLTQVRLSPISRSVKEVKDRITKGENIRGTEVFWVSDFQKSTIGTAAGTALDSLQNWHLIPITFDKLSNVFVDTVYLENPFASSGENNVLKLKVRNDGTQDVEQLSVKLILNGLQAGATTVTVSKGGISEATFNLNTRLQGLNKAMLSFNDFPVAFDNEFYFTLNFREKIRVTEIRPSSEATAIEKVFGNREVFSFQAYPISNFDYSRLKEADLVIVNGLNTLDPSLSIALREYQRQGGTLFLVPGKNIDLPSWKTFLQLPVLNQSVGTVMQELDKPDFQSPFFENVFEEKSTSVVMPKAIPVLDWGTDRTSILGFKNEKPFLSRFEQDGTIYLVSSPLDNTFTDFYNHALFVPVMYRMAASSKKNDRKLYYTLRETFLTLRTDSLSTEGQVRLINEEEIIPSQRAVGSQIFLDLPRFSLKTGFYKVVAGRDTVDLLAFNTDKAESLMGQAQEEEIKTYFGGGANVSIFDAGNTDTFSNEIKERYLGTPLWKYAILLALFFLLAEVLLIRFLK